MSDDRRPSRILIIKTLQCVDPTCSKCASHLRDIPCCWKCQSERMLLVEDVTRNSAFEQIFDRTVKIVVLKQGLYVHSSRSDVKNCSFLMDSPTLSYWIKSCDVAYWGPANILGISGKDRAQQKRVTEKLKGILRLIKHNPSSSVWSILSVTWLFQKDSNFHDEVEEELTTVRPRLCLHPFVASPWPWHSSLMPSSLHGLTTFWKTCGKWWVHLVNDCMTPSLWYVLVSRICAHVYQVHLQLTVAESWKPLNV